MVAAPSSVPDSLPSSDGSAASPPPSLASPTRKPTATAAASPQLGSSSTEPLHPSSREAKAPAETVTASMVASMMEHLTSDLGLPITDVAVEVQRYLRKRGLPARPGVGSSGSGLGSSPGAWAVALPSDVLTVVLMFLCTGDLGRTARVCRKWRVPACTIASQDGLRQKPARFISLADVLCPERLLHCWSSVNIGLAPGHPTVHKPTSSFFERLRVLCLFA